ncbi:MAG: sodium:solute symporter, partial [Gemmatimonadetes bacterium]|nr:sodium:solute symporter [Gemmatimonadota bacterium]
FVFYLFRPQPLLFNPAQERAVRAAQPAEYAGLEARFAEAASTREAMARRLAARPGEGSGSADGSAASASDGDVEAFRAAERDVAAVRAEALGLAERVTGEPSRDVNYVIPRFVIEELPIGLIGLFLAGIMAAAMSSIAAELNSLSTATVVDFYRRWVKPDAGEAHLLSVSKWATGVWGLFAAVVATFAATLGSLIEVVNRFGSFFYGSILGVFLLAMIGRARASGAFLGLLAGMGTVAAVTFGAPHVSFLWHNVIGAVAVVVVGLLVSVVWPGRPAVDR